MMYTIMGMYCALSGIWRYIAHLALPILDKPSLLLVHCHLLPLMAIMAMDNFQFVDEWSFKGENRGVDRIGSVGGFGSHPTTPSTHGS